MKEKYKKTAIKALNEGDYEKALHFLRLCAEGGSHKDRLEYAYLLLCMGYYTDSAYISIFENIISGKSPKDAYIILISMLSDKGDDSVKYYFNSGDFNSLAEKGTISQGMLCERVFEGEDISAFKAVFDDIEDDYEIDFESLEREYVFRSFFDGKRETCECGDSTDVESIENTITFVDNKEKKPSMRHQKSKPALDFKTNQMFYSFNSDKDVQEGEDTFFFKVSDYFYTLSDKRLKQISMLTPTQMDDIFKGKTKTYAKDATACEIGQIFETIITKGFRRSASVVLKHFCEKGIYNFAGYFSEICSKCFPEQTEFLAYRAKSLGCISAEGYAEARDEYISACNDDADVFELLLFTGDYDTIIERYNKCIDNLDNACTRLHFYALALYGKGLYEDSLKAFRNLADMDCFNPFYRFMIFHIDSEEDKNFDFSRSRVGIPVKEFILANKTIETLKSAVQEKNNYYLCEIVLSGDLFSQKLFTEIIKYREFDDMVNRMLLSASTPTENKFPVLSALAKSGKDLIFSDHERLYRIKNDVPSKYRVHAFRVVNTIILAGGTPESDIMQAAYKMYSEIEKKYAGYPEIEKMSSTLYCLTAVSLFQDLNLLKICYILDLDYSFTKTLVSFHSLCDD